MRPLLSVLIYLTALCGAGVSAAYVSLVLVERAERLPDAAEAGRGREDPAAERARFVRQASVFTWGMTGGFCFFVLAHLLGFFWGTSGVGSFGGEAEDLLRGLWVHLGAAVVAALLGGVLGYLAG